VDLIDEAKAIAFFGRTQGWDEQMVRRQVLTPIEDSSLLGTEHADPESIMCYQIPGILTKDGKPILGGRDISALDSEFMATIYPMLKPVPKPKPKPKPRRKPKGGRRKAARKTVRKAVGKTGRRKAARRS